MAKSARSQRPEGHTRARAQQVALHLFTTRGYELTSLREIAEALGIRKASLYYHFRNKEEIVQAIIAGRTAEAQGLLDWVRTQPAGPGLLRQTVRRWLGTDALDKLRGVRFVNANPLLMRRVAGEADTTLGQTLEAVLRQVLGAAAPTPTLLLARLAFVSLNAAAIAAEGTAASDEDVMAAAYSLAELLLDRLDAESPA